MAKIPKRYKADGKKFSGGMSSAEVYIDQHLGRKVIIKQLEPTAQQKRLLDEISALSDIRSKHVVQVYEVLRDEKDNIFAIVEEYLPGEDLTTKCGKVSLNEWMRISYAISCGISDIHDKGRIHRDIKDNNMKFDAEGCLKIFDFGLSRLNKSAKTQGSVGTPGFMAPELFSSSPLADVKFTAAVDVFAFGATLLKLGLGKLPVPLTHIPPKLPSASIGFGRLSFGVPGDLIDLLDKCLLGPSASRPLIKEVKNLLSAHLVRGQHKARFVFNGQLYEINNGNQTVRIRSGSLGECVISYDGLHFSITSLTGNLYVNNVIVTAPHVLPGSCVLTFGSPSLGAKRRHVPIDVSHPEVVL